MNKNNNNSNDIKMLILVLQLSSSYTIIVLKHHIEEREQCVLYNVPNMTGD